MDHQETLPPSTVLYRLATGHYVSHALHAAVELAIADHLQPGPLTADALAEATGCHAPSLRRMLRLLVTEGVFVEHDDGRFATTPLGDAMVHREGGFSDAVQLFAGRSVWEPWSDLVHTVRTGEPAFARAHGMGPFEYFAQHPEEAAAFDRAMASFTAGASRAVAESYDFSGFSRVIDIGGGEGALLAGVLRANPHLEGAVFDLERAGDRARAYIAGADLAERYSFVAGDFFESIPSGFDAYLIKHVIHDWDDERALAILRNIRAAIGRDGKLLLVEGIYPEKVDASVRASGAARNDCNMMVVTGGRQRSEDDLRQLYAEAGFRLARVVPTPARLAVVEGVPAD